MHALPFRNDLNDGGFISTLTYWPFNMSSIDDIFALGPAPLRSSWQKISRSKAASHTSGGMVRGR